MRLNDLIAGVLVLLVGGAVALYARSFPSTPGAGIGPGVFPLLIGAGLLLCGVVLVWGGLQERAWSFHPLPSREAIQSSDSCAPDAVVLGSEFGSKPSAGIDLSPSDLHGNDRQRPDHRQTPGKNPDAGDKGGLAFNGVLVVGALIFYTLAAETVGFFLAGFIFLASLFLAFGVNRRWIAPLAAAVTLGIHVAFYTLLRVPLPWGWFEGMAW